MKTIKFLAIAFVIVSLALTSFADSTTVDSVVLDSTVVEAVVDSVSVETIEPVVTESGFFQNLSLYEIVLFLVGVFEVVVRLYPTTKNYSVLSLVNSVINFIFPNNKKDGGKF